MVESQWLKHVVQVFSFTGSNHTKWLRAKMLTILTFLFAKNCLNSSLVKTIWNQIKQWSWTYTMKVKLLVLTINGMLGQQMSIYPWSWVDHCLVWTLHCTSTFWLTLQLSQSVKAKVCKRQREGHHFGWPSCCLLLRQRTYKRVTLKREAHKNVSSRLSLLWKQDHAI